MRSDSIFLGDSDCFHTKREKFFMKHPRISKTQIKPLDYKRRTSKCEIQPNIVKFSTPAMKKKRLAKSQDEDFWRRTFGFYIPNNFTFYPKKMEGLSEVQGENLFRPKTKTERPGKLQVTALSRHAMKTERPAKLQVMALSRHALENGKPVNLDSCNIARLIYLYDLMEKNWKLQCLVILAMFHICFFVPCLESMRGYFNFISRLRLLNPKSGPLEFLLDEILLFKQCNKTSISNKSFVWETSAIAVIEENLRAKVMSFSGTSNYCLEHRLFYNVFHIERIAVLNEIFRGIILLKLNSENSNSSEKFVEIRDTLKCIAIPERIYFSSEKLSLSNSSDILCYNTPLKDFKSKNSINAGVCDYSNNDSGYDKRKHSISLKESIGFNLSKINDYSDGDKDSGYDERKDSISSTESLGFNLSDTCGYSGSDKDSGYDEPKDFISSPEKSGLDLYINDLVNYINCDDDESKYSVISPKSPGLNLKGSNNICLMDNKSDYENEFLQVTYKEKKCASCEKKVCLTSSYSDWCGLTEQTCEHFICSKCFQINFNPKYAKQICLVCSKSDFNERKENEFTTLTENKFMTLWTADKSLVLWT